MPRKDIIHEAVNNALIKNGWEITAAPYTLRHGDKEIHIDLSAETLLAAERGDGKIAIIVRSNLFSRRRHFSPTAEL